MNIPSTTDILSSGSLAALNATVALTLNGQSAATVQVTGTWVGTLQFEGTLDGTTWIPINAIAASTSAPQPTTTVNGLYRITPAGLATFRVNATAYTSGTAVITMRASGGVGGTFINQIAPIKITNGTDTAAIKAASTPAVATDPALVVAISPNNVVPVSGTFFQAIQPVSLTAGSSIIGKVGIDQTTNGTTNRINIGTDGQVNVAQTIFQYSANGINSSVTQLVASATFTGILESIPNQSDYSVLVFSDQNANITINEYIDATTTFKVYSKIYTYLANSQFAVSAPANGNYFQIVVQNTGVSTTTLLNINTAYGTIRSATQLNNAPSAINELNGTVIDTNSGNKSAGTQRMVLATDQPNLTTPLNVSLPATSVTYSTVVASLAPALTATDIVTIYGSATKTVNILNIWVTGIQTTAGQAQFMLIKRSTVNTLGTSTPPTKVTYDSNDIAATATVLAYTANPTLGTAIGNVRGDRVFLPGAASASDAQGLLWSFVNGKPMILRGVAQGLCINLNGVTITGGSINVTIEWTES